MVIGGLPISRRIPRGIARVAIQCVSEARDGRILQLRSARIQLSDEITTCICSLLICIVCVGPKASTSTVATNKERSIANVVNNEIIRYE